MCLLPLIALAVIAQAASVIANNPKRGLAYPNERDHLQDIARAYGTSVSWTYNWGVNSMVSIPSSSGITHVPMQWGVQGAEGFFAQVVGGGYQTVLAFNEPDLPSQSNVSPDQAVRTWKEHIQPLKQKGVRLGSPGISSAPSGKSWLKEFLDKCHDCNVDFIAVHWYGEGGQNFINYLSDIHAAFQRFPVWVTEFGCTSGNDNGEPEHGFRKARVLMPLSDVQTFLRETIGFMDSTGWVEKYAWFAFDRYTAGLRTNLLDGNGNLNTLGRMYVG
ncbi:hypothetical protein VNI00_000053 [Paramarasmius palmivorus]|uniref:Asl1-like glycosyl hydrolase catalytic domain-containing protein n=1 Tax=Paramarasmius palmivorus TaxID=297713 RepID=A0AAW0EEY5_9AGAR